MSYEQDEAPLPPHVLANQGVPATTLHQRPPTPEMVKHDAQEDLLAYSIVEQSMSQHLPYVEQRKVKDGWMRSAAIVPLLTAIGCVAVSSSYSLLPYGAIYYLPAVLAVIGILAGTGGLIRSRIRHDQTFEATFSWLGLFLNLLALTMSFCAYSVAQTHFDRPM